MSQKPSLLAHLYRGQVSLGQTFWLYWLLLGVVWYGLWLLLLCIPLLAFADAVTRWIVDHIQSIQPISPEGWSNVKWIAPILLVCFFAPNFLFLHTLTFTVPLWRALAQVSPSSFWRTIVGRCLVLFLPFTIVFLGVLGVVFGLVFGIASLITGPAVLVLKGITFFLGLVPHGVLVGILWLIRIDSPVPLAYDAAHDEPGPQLPDPQP